MRLDRQGDLTTGRFIADALQNPVNGAILQRLPALGLPDAWLVAGCLFQTVWNLQSGRPPATGIKDYDLFYFDGADLSDAAEARVGARGEAAFADLGGTIEAKNQARVLVARAPGDLGRMPPVLGADDLEVDFVG